MKALETITKRIDEINKELLELSNLKEGLESQLKAIDLKITQLVGAVNELESVKTSIGA